MGVSRRHWGNMRQLAKKLARAAFYWAGFHARALRRKKMKRIGERKMGERNINQASPKGEYNRSTETEA
jgi:hypothetical protein